MNNLTKLYSLNVKAHLKTTCINNKIKNLTIINVKNRKS